MLSETRLNDPFYGHVVEEFYQSARQRHPKFPLIRKMEYGVAVCVLPPTFDDYLKLIEASARRNLKKAARNGYSLQRINFNDYLEDIRAIRQSTEVRQGKVPDDFLNGPVMPCQNPPSLNPNHDYPYFGVLQAGQLYAYAGCLIAGELCMIEHIFGHAARQEDGIVPMLYVGIAEYLFAHHPQVRYYGYDTYFGATPSMRRFKKKFHFLPHRVQWLLGQDNHPH